MKVITLTVTTFCIATKTFSFVSFCTYVIDSFVFCPYFFPLVSQVLTSMTAIIFLSSVACTCLTTFFLASSYIIFSPSVLTCFKGFISSV